MSSQSNSTPPNQSQFSISPTYELPEAGFAPKLPRRLFNPEVSFSPAELAAPPKASAAEATPPVTALPRLLAASVTPETVALVRELAVLPIDVVAPDRASEVEVARLPAVEVTEFSAAFAVLLALVAAPERVAEVESKADEATWVALLAKFEVVDEIESSVAFAALVALVAAPLRAADVELTTDDVALLAEAAKLPAVELTASKVADTPEEMVLTVVVPT